MVYTPYVVNHQGRHPQLEGMLVEEAVLEFLDGNPLNSLWLDTGVI